MDEIDELSGSNQTEEEDADAEGADAEGADAEAAKTSRFDPPAAPAEGEDDVVANPSLTSYNLNISCYY